MSKSTALEELHAETEMAFRVQSVLMSRFLIDLRKADADDYFFSTSTATNFPDRARFSAVQLRVPTTLNSLPTRGTVLGPQVWAVPIDPEGYSAPPDDAASTQTSVNPGDTSAEPKVVDGSIVEVSIRVRDPQHIFAAAH